MFKEVKHPLHYSNFIGINKIKFSLRSPLFKGVYRVMRMYRRKFNLNGVFMHYLDIDFIEELITAKIKGSVIRRSMLLRLLSNTNLDYQTTDYELVINRLIKDGKLIETDEFIRYKDTEDLTKLFVEHNGVHGIWASKT